MEGISQEAITLAGHLKLNHLTVLFDDNGVSIDGKVSMSDSTDQLARYAAAGWNVTRVDGHDVRAVAAALEAAQTSDKPSFIACKTIIGYGAPPEAADALRARHGRSGLAGVPARPNSSTPYPAPCPRISTR